MTPEWVSAISAVVAAIFALLSCIVSWLARRTAENASKEVGAVEERVTRVTYQLEEFRQNFSRPMDMVLHRLTLLRDELENMIEQNASQTKFEMFERQYDSAWNDLRGRLRIAITARYIHPSVLRTLLETPNNPYDQVYDAIADIRATEATESRARSFRRFDEAMSGLIDYCMRLREDAANRIFERFNS